MINLRVNAKVNGGQNGCEECRHPGTDRPDETDPTNPTEQQREFLSQCFRLSVNWCHYCGEVVDKYDRCGCDYGG